MNRKKTSKYNVRAVEESDRRHSTVDSSDRVRLVYPMLGSVSGFWGNAERSETLYVELEMRDNPAYLLRERLFEELEKHLGENNMTLDNILRAIRKGVGRGSLLEIKRLYDRSINDSYLVQRVLPEPILKVMLGL